MNGGTTELLERQTAGVKFESPKIEGYFKIKFVIFILREHNKRKICRGDSCYVKFDNFNKSASERLFIVLNEISKFALSCAYVVRCTY